MSSYVAGFLRNFFCLELCLTIGQQLSISIFCWIERCFFLFVSRRRCDCAATGTAVKCKSWRKQSQSLNIVIWCRLISAKCIALLAIAAVNMHHELLLRSFLIETSSDQLKAIAKGTGGVKCITQPIRCHVSMNLLMKCCTAIITRLPIQNWQPLAGRRLLTFHHVVPINS